MKLDLNQIKRDYESSKGWREFKKWAFTLGTFGIGGLYLAATTCVIRQGEIGLRANARGELTLLPPGRHSNFPWESYPVAPQSLAKKVIDLGPYKIITVETGDVAKTFNRGTLEILDTGQHLLTDASHVFSSFIPVRQETKKLHEVTAYTSDNVGLTLHADVRYQIEDPKQAISQIDDIEESIKQIAEINISQIVGHHNLADFAPNTMNIDPDHHHGMGDVIQELFKNIRAQFQQLGIKLLNIGITSWSINDKNLAHELAQGAVLQSQTQSRKISAARDAEITIIEAEAQAKANQLRAQGEANAIKLRGEAIETVAKNFTPVAAEMYDRAQQVELVQKAQNPHLFFASNAPSLTPQLTLPVSVSGAQNTL